MKYKDHIIKEMEWLARKMDTVFIGENIINAGRIYNTLDKVPLHKCVEFPICENLIAGCAFGLALEEYKPIVVFQRMDFMLLASDAIINHIALIPELSGGVIKLPIIIRAIIGSKDKKFDVGTQHNKDLSHVFEPYLDVVKYKPGVYRTAYSKNKPIIVVENRDDYNKEIK